MKRFVQGQSRTQTTLLPECLDDYVAEDNPAWVIDAFIDQLDLGQLGFESVEPAATGHVRPESAVTFNQNRRSSSSEYAARSMKTRGTGIVGYNVQCAVDTKHHLIIAHEVTNDGIDRSQLSSMAEQARNALGCKELSVVADRGYFKSEEILACEQAGIRPIVPRPQTSNSKAEGRFGKQDFVYDAQTNEYRCPAGQRLIYRYTSLEAGLRTHTYWSSACQGCAIKKQCTPSTERRVRRWENEAVLDAMQDRLDHAPEMMRIRRQTVEHPFGTIKAWMGATHFLTRTLPRVSTEMSLHVLAYNLKRVMNLLGIAALIRAIKVRRIFLRSIRSRFGRITTVLRAHLGQRIRQLRFLISHPEAA